VGLGYLDETVKFQMLLFMAFAPFTVLVLVLIYDYREMQKAQKKKKE